MYSADVALYHPPRPTHQSLSCTSQPSKVELQHLFFVVCSFDEAALSADLWNKDYV